MIAKIIKIARFTQPAICCSEDAVEREGTWAVRSTMKYYR